MKADPVKLRKLHAEMGRWVLLARPNGVVVHRATIVSVRPTGRQVYPRLAYDLHCGSTSDGTHEVEGSPINNTLVTCEGCRTKQWHGVIECQKRINAIQIERLREQGHMHGLTTEPRQ